MGVVHLENDLLRQVHNIVVVLLETLKGPLQGSRYEEVLLLQAEFLAGFVGIIGVEDLAQGPGQVLVLHGLDIVAPVKGLEGEDLLGLSIPDHQGIDDVVPIAGDGHIIRNGNDGIIAFLNEGRGTVVLGHGPDIAPELDLIGIFGPLEFEGIAVLQPVVRNLLLVAIRYLLLEHTVAVADTAAVGRIAQGGKRVKEAGRQTPEAAVAEGRVRFLVFDVIDIDSHLLEGFLHCFIGAEVDEIVSQKTADQKLHRHIIDNLRIASVHLVLGGKPVVNDIVLHCQGYRLENLLTGCFLEGLPVEPHDILLNVLLEFFLVDHT